MFALAADSHPIWMCSFRSFFLAAATLAITVLGLWSAFLGPGLPLPAVVGGPLVWHAHELLFGFALAAISGFALTAVPEFTHNRAISARTVRPLLGLWLLGRLGFWLSGWLGWPALALAGLAHLGLVAGLVAVLGPCLLRDPLRRHRSFLWALCMLAVLIAGFYADALHGIYPMRWLHASIGLMMALIVVAMSRISTRMVNDAIDEPGEAIEGESERSEYRARPPKRNLAIACIILYTSVEFLAPGVRVAGWLALATAAALFHLQSDWHIGRTLFRRWPLMLFSVYLLMAGGYAMLGLITLGSNDGAALSGARHLLTAGALSLNIYLVLVIVGHVHTGHAIDTGRWIPLGAGLIIAAAVLRATGGLGMPLPVPTNTLHAFAGILWLLAYALCIRHVAPLLTMPRQDGGTGCEEAPEPSAVAASTGS